MKYCTSCGQNLSGVAKFCTSCGAKIDFETIINETPKYDEITSNANEISTLRTNEIYIINKKISLQNSQSGIVKKSWYTAAFFAFVLILAFIDVDILPIHPAVVFISFFFLLSSVVIGFMFKSREKKLQSLISGENLIASWTLNPAEKEQYVTYLFQNEKGKNKGIFIVIAVLIMVIFGAFIVFIEEGKAAMFFIMLALLVFISIFALGMPFYYKKQNSLNDGHVLIGKKYAYINGYFHNWDFPLSGIKKASIIHEPFYGLHLQYYYTDRTFTNTEEINIPAPQNFDLQGVLNGLKSLN